MADLHRRLAGLVLLTLLVFAWGQARAYPASGGGNTCTFAWGGGGQSGSAASEGAAEAQVLSYKSGWMTDAGWTLQSECSGNCADYTGSVCQDLPSSGSPNAKTKYWKYLYNGTITQPGPGWFVQATRTGTAAPGCPNGGTLSGSECVCASSDYDNGSACVPKTNCLPGEAYNAATNTCSCPSSGTSVGDSSMVLTFTTNNTVSNNRVCFGYCQLDADTCIKGYLAGQLAGTECYGPYKSTGQSCNPSSFGGGTIDPSNPTPIEPNKPGHCWGQIDLGSGLVDVQLPCDSISKESGKAGGNVTEKTNPDGTKEVTTEEKTQQTECTGDKCRTSETTTRTTQTYDANGNPVGNPTVTETRVEKKPEDSDMGTFCQQNPTAPGCVASKWGGSCGSFSCEGDAVQCALAREIHTRNCTLYADHTGGAGSAEAVAWYDANSKGQGLTKAGNEGLFTTGTLPTLDTTTRSLAGSALQDLSVPLWGGQTLVVPFSSLNPILGYMGAVLIAVALIIAARIFHHGATA